MVLRGSCLCGAVGFSVSPPFALFSYCYCTRCRKATGADRAAVLIVKPDQLQWAQGSVAAKRWDLPSASSFATAFCPTCGCAQPRLTRDGKWAVVPAGALDDAPPIEPECHEHWASRARWVCEDGPKLPIYPADAP